MTSAGLRPPAPLVILLLIVFLIPFPTANTLLTPSKFSLPTSRIAPQTSPLSFCVSFLALGLYFALLRVSFAPFDVLVLVFGVSFAILAIHLALLGVPFAPLGVLVLILVSSFARLAFCLSVSSTYFILSHSIHLSLSHRCTQMSRPPTILTPRQTVGPLALRRPQELMTRYEFHQ
jgi:hypothetical protein